MTRVDLSATVKSKNNAGGLGAIWVYVNGEEDAIERGRHKGSKRHGLNNTRQGIAGQGFATIQSEETSAEEIFEWLVNEGKGSND